MEALLFIVGLYGGIFLLGWIIQRLNELFQKHREKIRDKAAADLFSEQSVNPDALIGVYTSKLNSINFQRYDPVQAWFSRLKKKRYSELQEQCPVCHEGHLTLRKGQYGKFLGCSSYPRCKHTVAINEAQKKYRNNLMSEFKKDLEEAYGILR